MADPVYGSPDLDDATAYFDKLVDSSSKWMKDFVREIGPQILNRPMGTVPISSNDRLADFIKVMRDPAGLQAIHAQRVQQMGMRQGTVDFIKWYQRHMKRIT
mgnify:CR=1 FL=1